MALAPECLQIKAAKLPETKHYIKIAMLSSFVNFPENITIIHLITYFF